MSCTNSALYGRVPHGTHRWSRTPQRHPLRTSLRVEGLFQDAPRPSFGGHWDHLAQRFSPLIGKDEVSPPASLEERISSREFSRKSIAQNTQSLRKSLASMGPLGFSTQSSTRLLHFAFLGRVLAYQCVQFCRWRLHSCFASLPEASGSLAEMVDKPFFEPLYELFRTYGGIFKLSFGPRSFVIVSDPQMMREILSTSAEKYSKGILSDILEFVMGNGLIPANGEIWIERRRAIVPSLHKAFIENMIRTFSDCTERGLEKLASAAQKGESVEVEAFFSRLALDIIGHAVFDHDFDATTHDDPVIQAVYTVLREAEHRSVAAVPWWKVPFLDVLVPQQRHVKESLAVINETLDRLVHSVHEALEKDDSFDTSTASILHFLIASGTVVSSQQLRDDLMTLLIAGHETTAAVLTWTFFELSKRPNIVKEMQDEIDRVLGDRPATSSALFQLDLCTRVLAEAMRLYPQPPVLIRRALESVRLGKYELPEGTDIFLSVWNLHRSPDLWENPLEFNPDRFPKKAGMPNEISTDFRYLPFGGGRRKCIGSQFALLESLEIVASILRNYNFRMAPDAPKVRMTSGATIHSANGLYLQFTERLPSAVDRLPEISEEQPIKQKCPFHSQIVLR